MFCWYCSSTRQSSTSAAHLSIVLGSIALDFSSPIFPTSSFSLLSLIVVHTHLSRQYAAFLHWAARQNPTRCPLSQSSYNAPSASL